MPVDENQCLVALHQHRVELVMGVFYLVRHRRMSGQEKRLGTNRLGAESYFIKSAPPQSAGLANWWADPQFNTVRKINPLHVRCRRPLLRQSPRRIAREVTIKMLYSERPAR
jgi:hypothetical protein